MSKAKNHLDDIIKANIQSLKKSKSDKSTYFMLFKCKDYSNYLPYLCNIFSSYLKKNTAKENAFLFNYDEETGAKISSGQTSCYYSFWAKQMFSVCLLSTEPIPLTEYVYTEAFYDNDYVLGILISKKKLRTNGYQSALDLTEKESNALRLFMNKVNPELPSQVIIYDFKDFKSKFDINEHLKLLPELIEKYISRDYREGNLIPANSDILLPHIIEEEKVKLLFKKTSCLIYEYPESLKIISYMIIHNLRNKINDGNPFVKVVNFYSENIPLKDAIKDIREFIRRVDFYSDVKSKCYIFRDSPKELENKLSEKDKQLFIVENSGGDNNSTIAKHFDNLDRLDEPPVSIPVLVSKNSIDNTLFLNIDLDKLELSKYNMNLLSGFIIYYSALIYNKNLNLSSEDSYDQIAQKFENSVIELSPYHNQNSNETNNHTTETELNNQEVQECLKVLRGIQKYFKENRDAIIQNYSGSKKTDDSGYSLIERYDILIRKLDLCGVTYKGENEILLFGIHRGLLSKYINTNFAMKLSDFTKTLEIIFKDIYNKESTTISYSTKHMLLNIQYEDFLNADFTTDGGLKDFEKKISETIKLNQKTNTK